MSPTFEFGQKLIQSTQGAPLQAWTECASLIGCDFKMIGKDDKYFAANVTASRVHRLYLDSQEISDGYIISGYIIYIDHIAISIMMPG